MGAGGVAFAGAWVADPDPNVIEGTRPTLPG